MGFWFWVGNILFHMCGWFACMYVYVPHTFQVPKEARRGHQLPWNWSSKGLWPIMWILGAELKSPGRATSTLTCRAIPPISRPCIWKVFWIGPVILPFQLQNRARWKRERGTWKEMMKQRKPTSTSIPLTGRKMAQNQKADSVVPTQEFPDWELAVGGRPADESESLHLRFNRCLHTFLRLSSLLPEKTA